MKIKHFLALLLAALFMFSLTLTITAEGGGEQEPDPSTYSLMPQIPLTEEQKAAIKADYVEYFKENYSESSVSSVTADDIMIGKHYGPYSGSYALFIWHKEVAWPAAVTSEFVAEYEFVYRESQTLLFYKDSKFYKLQEAYDDEILKREELRDLWWYFKPFISHTETRPAYSKGDLNGDGKVTPVDYLLLKRMFAGTYTPSEQQLSAADINKDGAVGPVDYLALKRYYLQTYYFPPY